MAYLPKGNYNLHEIFHNLSSTYLAQVTWSLPAWRILTSLVLLFDWFYVRSCFSDACDYLISQLLPVNENERTVWLEKIIEYLQKKNSLREPVVEKIHVVTAIEVNSDYTFVIIYV